MMLLLGPLFLAAASVIWAEEQYYLVSLNDTWDNARNYCQKCYKDLTTITPGNVQLIQNLIIQIPISQNFTAQNLTAQNLTAQNFTAQKRSSAYWIGLRQNFSGSLFWSQWSNGAPVIYQNCCGMWREKHCYEFLPFICYDDRFFGEVSISNVTHDEGFLSWSQAPGNIDHYRVEQNRVNPPNTDIKEVTGLNITLQNLVPGTQYNIKVIPVKCGRDLNPQNISFSTLPMDISNVSIVNVKCNSVVLNWSAPIGGRDNYSVNWLEGNNKTLCTEKGSISKAEQYNITGLIPGQLYSLAVCAVVNKTIFGEPGRISVYTEPSRVDTLISANNMSSDILAWWNSSDRQASDYSYHVVLMESSMNKTIVNFQTSSTIVKWSNLTAGTQYNLTVSAIVNGSVEGETLTIEAYTTPETVNNLALTSTHDSINATWDPPNGSYYHFSVELYLNSINSTENITQYTKERQYSFSNLKSAALYFVNVITHVKLDKYPSKPASGFCYTLPVQPANISVTFINSTTVDLKWESPKNSEGVTNLNYNVTYKSFFWGSGSTLNETGNNKTIFGLQTGTRYNFSVSVYAGQLQSLPVSINYTTAPNHKNLTLTMLCSSATSLYCKKDSTKTLFQKELEKKMQSKFGDDIVWHVEMKEGK
ncbi:hypothetical protein AOLI_G00110560 [Acnodon oligacanthus]